MGGAVQITPELRVLGSVWSAHCVATSRSLPYICSMKGLDLGFSKALQRS